MARLTGRGSRIVCRGCGFDVGSAMWEDATPPLRVESRGWKIILREIQVRVRGK